MSNRCTFPLLPPQKKRKEKKESSTTLPHYDAAAVMNAAVFKMLICWNEMHRSEPLRLL